MTDKQSAQQPSTDPKSTDPGSPDQVPAVSYGEATAEIDRILAELERDDLDVDLLATKVRRAAELLTLCRDRIRFATEDVQDAVNALNDDSDDSTEDHH